MDTNYLGIDIGGTNVKAVVLSPEGTLLEQTESPTIDASDPASDWRENVCHTAHTMTAKYGGKSRTLAGCGISAPGLADAGNRCIRHMPERLAGIEGYDWSAALGQDAWVLNDGHSACLAEYESFYRKEGIRNMLLVTLGTGVGGGIIIAGGLYQGNLQRAGHVGHLSVDHAGPETMTRMPGSLEYAIGNFSVARRTGNRYGNVRDLVAGFRDKNEDATRWWLDSVRKLAVALAGLTNILAPEVIVLGGGIAAGAKNSLTDPLADFMDQFEWRPGGYRTRIETAGHGAYSGAIGAAFFAREMNLKQKEQ